jgi:hypothetical protein
MKLTPLLRVELRQYFEIKRDLAAAVRAAASVEVEHHIDELQILAMHTSSDKLRRACASTVAEQGPILPHVANA